MTDAIAKAREALLDELTAEIIRQHSPVRDEVRATIEKVLQNHQPHPSPDPQAGIGLETTAASRQRIAAWTVQNRNADIPAVVAAILRDIDRLLAERRQPAGEEVEALADILGIAVAPVYVGDGRFRDVGPEAAVMLRTLSRCPPDEAVRRAVELFEWLDRRGGLGIDVHERINDVLDLLSPAQEAKK